MDLTAQDVERFWSKVDRRGPDECWPWTKGTYGDTGYGCFWLKGRSWGAHVVVLLICGIEIPAGHLVLHECDNPPCCNPAHVHPGTQSQNIKDAHARGRIDQRGERNHQAKVTGDIVREMRGMFTGKRGEQAQFCRTYGLSPATVNEIVHRRIWRDVE